MSTFPDFFLHFDTKERKTLKVDRSAESEGAFTIAIKLEEALAKKLLNGVISETNLLVNHYAVPPYVIDKTFFPENQNFYFLYLNTSFVVVQLVTQLDRVTMKENNQSAVKIEELIAYSILTGETAFNDWKVSFSRTGEPIVDLSDEKSGLRSSTLFNNRTDFISLVEINLREGRAKGNSWAQKICTIMVDHFENSITIKAEQHPIDDLFKDFIVAITRKNDPSYLIKKLNVQNGQKLKLVFDEVRLSDLSFFSSKYHILHSDVIVKNKSHGSVEILVSTDKVVLRNDIMFGPDYKECSVFLRNKYDKSQVYTVLKLVIPGKMVIVDDSLDFSHVDFDIPSISKHNTKIIRDT